MPLSEVFNEDCMEGMKRYPDKYFDLAVCDPPYGLNESSKKIQSRHHSQKKYGVKDWDRFPPPQDYFTELFRVSKNQIIFGANHFGNLPASSCWIVWDKDGFGDQADCELAYTSFKTAVRKFKYTWNGFRQQNMGNKEIRIHPTQKPVDLYKWIIKNYSQPTDKILDTHLGSGSNRIACYDAGLDFTAFETDREYFDQQEKRFQQFKSQTKLF